MAELNLSKGLKFQLGDATVEKLGLLKELGEKTTELFATPEYFSNDMMVSISRKTRKLNQFLLQVNNVDKQRIAKVKKAEQVKEAMTQWLGGDLEKFSQELDAEIKSVKAHMEEKAKAIALQVTEETKAIAESSDKRIEDDIDLLRQEKEALFEERLQLKMARKEVTDEHKKALVEYQKKRNFFANFREVRSQVDEKTGKKPGFFASIKKAFTFTQDSRIEEVDRRRRNELDEIANRKNELSERIDACEMKIVALGKQRTEVNQEILQAHSIIAEELKAHLDKAEEYKTEFEQWKVALNEREARLVELQNTPGSANEEMEEVKKEIEYYKELAEEAERSAEREAEQGAPTVENVVVKMDEIEKELDELGDEAETYEESMAYGKQAAMYQKEKRKLMKPVVKEEFEKLYGKLEEPAAEQEAVVEEKAPETKKELSYEELQEKYQGERNGQLEIVNAKLEEVEEALKHVKRRAEKARLEAEKAQLMAEKKEYERPLTKKEVQSKGKLDGTNEKLEEIEEALKHVTRRSEKARLEAERDQLNANKEKYERKLSRRSGRESGMDR